MEKIKLDFCRTLTDRGNVYFECVDNNNLTGDYYRAADVDALLMKIANVIGSPKDVGRLPEALKYVLSSYRYRCEKTEAKHDALLADVRRLVEAAGKSVWFEKQHLKATCPGCLEYPNDTCSHGEEFSPIVQLLTQAIAAVERHLEKVA